MNCPKCGGHQAYKIKDDSNFAKVRCPECGYECWLKHYRAEMQLKKPCPRCKSTKIRQILPADDKFGFPVCADCRLILLK